MAFADLSPDLQQTIRRVCTPKELELLEILDAGESLRGAARKLGITRRSVKDRLESATRKIIAATEEAA